MKRLTYFLFIAIIILSSCSRGLNKSITEPMSVDELRANIQDTTFTDFYDLAQQLSKWITSSDVRQAKYGNISYKRLNKYVTHIMDTSFFRKKEKIWKEAYAKLYPDYSQQVDSIMNYWQEYRESYNMDSLVTIEFNDLWKEYYSYFGDIKNVNVGFRITPLKGTIDQLVFRYEMKAKVNNDGSIDLFNSHRCIASSPISKPRTLYWEADYSDEKILQSRSTTEVKRDYDFNIELENVRINGENYEDKLNAIPEPVMMALKYCTKEYNLYENDIIRMFLNSDYKDFTEYCQPLIDEEMKKYDQDVYDLLKAFYGDNENDYDDKND